MRTVRTRRRVSLAVLFALAMAGLAPWSTPQARADHTPNPSTVTLVGSLQSEAGCAGDWDPACAATRLTYDAADDVWQGAFALPAGSYEYKVALNGGWDENYGANAQLGGANIALTLGADGSVKFYYDHKSHWVAGSANARIVTAPGSFQSELGCGGDWDPGCLRSWLQDPDGDGTYELTTTALPPGGYDSKAAINESWGENYGAGGVRDGANITFNVPAAGTPMRFRFVSATNTLTIQAANASFPDDNVEWDGLRHDSRDSLYRTPFGAVPAGKDTEVRLRLRTFHNDVTGAALRLYDVNKNAQSFRPMRLAAADVSCYQADLDAAGRTCDYWEASVGDVLAPNNFWYRFVVTDGADTDYYGDNTDALDGGVGAASDDPIDRSYALMFFDPAFTAPAWARDAVIYQIFPDRFRNGRKDNDPRTGDTRYDDPVIKLDWGVLPEGYCRNYADGAANCPWRFDTTPPDWSPTKEGPRGRDYYGGDLKGVDQRLDYIRSLGVTTIYFNPIFDAGSNHSYDTQDYYRIDPYFGTRKDWDNLVKHAERRGIRIILDSVFNHMSSDSAFFDRYGHYRATGACEAANSAYRAWFNFRPPTGAEVGVCAPSAAGNDTYYTGWFGFDSIPEIKKSNPAVLDYFVTGRGSVSRFWLRQGAAGWRLDVMGDASFPAGYWESFRQVTRATKPDSLIIGELWQKDTTLLRHLRGETADGTMNYRQRDAIIGLLTPGAFDSKGFGDSGRVIAPSEFAARIESIREDYPDAAYYSLMNLLGSHDTERILWTLTPGAETLAEKQNNAANLADGKSRLQLASLINFVMPGAPTVYYGDEVGVTGDDDPDDRRTYPWADLGGNPDRAMEAHFKALAALRKSSPAFTKGDLKVLLADDAAGVVALGRRSGNSGALAVVNRSNAARTVTIPVAGYFPDGTALRPGYAVKATAGAVTVSNGTVTLTLPALSGVALTTQRADLTPPAAPKGLQLTDEGVTSVGLSWGAVSGAAAYNVYRSPVSGGGWVRVNTAPVTGPSFTDATAVTGQPVYYSIRALDAAGNESKGSNEIAALPHYKIGWANVQWPPSLTHTVSVVNRTDAVYGQVWIDGVTGAAGATKGLLAQLGYGPDGSDPRGASWVWVDASFNAQAGNNDEFQASLLPEAPGAYDYTYRYSTTGGRDWFYAVGGPDGGAPIRDLTVNGSGDAAAPAVPTGLAVTSASPAGIALTWEAVAGDPSLYGYELLRGAAAGGPFAQIARVTGTSYTDTAVASGETYFYAVRAVDLSFNRSGSSAAVQATAELRTVSVTFTVTVPASTDGSGREVHIAGFLDRLDGGLPQWNPGGVKLTRVDATTWRITLTGKETTQIEYKYALGSWDYVEKDGACGETANRTLTLAYGASGSQTVSDSVGNWRNVAPCGS